jgi:Uma2 family endonuclease
MAEAAEERWTVEELLAWDDGTDRRHELVDGRIVAMAPPSEAHAAIIPNLALAIHHRLRVTACWRRSASGSPDETTPSISSTWR